MVDNYSKIQQLLAESRFVDVQRECELIFSSAKGPQPIELMEIYFQSLLSQSKPLPPIMLLETLDRLSVSDPDKAYEWFEHADKSQVKNNIQWLTINMRLAEKRGRTDELWKLISEYQVYLYTNRKPIMSEEVIRFTHKYFKTDFQLQLQSLALDLLRNDFSGAEKLITDLILSCFERSTQKGMHQRISSLQDVLKAAGPVYHLEIYKSLCAFLLEGPKDKKEFKKIIELVIYHDQFKLQVLILHILASLNDPELTSLYASVVRSNKSYDFIYLDKYFPHLKKFFVQKSTGPSEALLPESITFEPAQSSTRMYSGAAPEEDSYDASEEEQLLVQVLKHQQFNCNDLLELAVSFLQSELPRAAYEASQRALSEAENNRDKLKAYYLQVTSQLKLKDFRACLDTAFQGLNYSETENDLLSFLYAQAEAFIRLGENRQAKATLKKILSMNSGYRMARERLERLNEV